MARQQHIGSAEDWFVGEDKTLIFEIYAGTGGTIQDITGYALRFRIYELAGDDRILLTCTTGGSTITITGSYNSDPDTNTQRANVLIADTDTDHWQPGRYGYDLWRTDSGNETVLAYGHIDLKKTR